VAFKPAHIEAQREQITSRCEALIDQLPVGEPFDLVPALAAPLPVMVIAEMLGVEDGDMAEFKLWSDAIFSNIADILFAEPSEAAVTASDAMNAYFLKEIEALRTSPRDHLLSRLVHVETDEGHLTDEELLSFCRLLLIAGNETTTGLITASARIFHELPETFVQLKEDPELAPSFVEEALRFYSPFSATARRTTRAVELSGQTIEAGELIIPLLASANRDESVFDTPERFKIDRSPNPHMGLGYGIHFCLGAHLARLEGAITAQRLSHCFSHLRLVEPELAIMGGLGGPKSLMVEVA
jgi:cytochrome P450